MRMMRRAGMYAPGGGVKWAKYTVEEETYFTLVEAGAKLFSITTWTGELYVGDGYTINDDGTFTVAETTMIALYSNSSAAVGKWIISGGTSAATKTGENVYQITKISYSSGTAKLTTAGYAAQRNVRTVRGEFVGYVSAAEGTYPANGIQGDYWYVLQISVEPVFANNTWEQIMAACQMDAVPDTWEIADNATMVIDGVSYIVDIIGKHQDAYADGSGTAPLTLQLHDCYGTTYALTSSKSNVGSWEKCLMRTTTLPQILAKMPSAVQNGIREVKKLTSEGDSRASELIETADKLFLLSEVEVTGNNAYSLAGEGSQYAYYSEGNSKIKSIGGEAQYWWLRSPKIESGSAFCMIYPTGGSNTSSYPNSPFGVSFAFCF